MAKTLQIVIAGVDKGGTKVFKDIDDAAETTQGKLAAMGSKIGPGVAAAATAVVAGVAFAVKGAYEAAAESAKISRETERVIRTTGASSFTTAEKIGELSSSISELTGADDELIQSGANLLLTFTNIQNRVGENNDIFDQATGLALDMSTVLGTDMSSASIQLGKALNDPVKGITALSRAGVSFTAEQKEQIKTLTKSGDILGAQKIILAELSKEFGGAAEAAATPVDKLRTKLGNLQEQVGAQLIPVFDTVAGIIGTVAEGFMNLPGPVQVVIEVLTLLGTGVFGATLLVSKMASMFGDTLAPVLGFVRKFADDAALGIANIATKMGASQTGAANFAAGLSGALGPAILGVGAAAVIGFGIFSLYQQGQKEADERAKAFSDTLDEQTGKITSNTTAQVRSNLEKQNQIDNLNKAGISVEAFSLAIGDNSVAIAANAEDLKLLSLPNNKMVDEQNAIRDALIAAGGARNDLIVTLDKEGAIDDGLINKIVELSAAYDDNIALQVEKVRQQGISNGMTEEEAGKAAAAASANIRHADALKEVAAELRAQTDPYFAAFRGLDQVKEAQEAFDKTVSEGKSLDDQKAAYIALAQATVGYKGDLLELDEQNKRNGTSNDDLKTSLDGLNEFGLNKTGAAADAAKQDLANLGYVAAVVGGQSVNIPVKIDAYAAIVAIDDVGERLEAMKKFAYSPTSRDYSSLPARAAGGPVNSNGTYLVGERGPELLQMGSSSGRVFSNSDSSRMLGGSSSMNVTINMPAGANGDDVVRALKQYERANGALYASA